MSNVLKQRLVGALAIMALGVIFWPLIFVDVERRPMDRDRQVPPMPLSKHARIEPPRPLTGVEPVAPPADIPLHDVAPEARDETAAEGASRERSQPRPRLDETGIPIAWVLQVVSVSDREKADELRDRLIKRGYKAYHRPIRREQGVLYRVYVGPVFDRARLAGIKRSIDRRFEVEAIVARYIP